MGQLDIWEHKSRINTEKAKSRIDRKLINKIDRKKDRQDKNTKRECRYRRGSRIDKKRELRQKSMVGM